MDEPVTEQRNSHTQDIDTVPVPKMLELMNDEDQSVPAAVRKAIPAISQVVEATAKAFRAGGRLLYVGAGTSGRLAASDAAECSPTFGVDADLVQAIAAGGRDEDNAEGGREAIRAHRIGPDDVVVGISANGNAAYVMAAMKHARESGAFVASLTCNERCSMAEIGQVAIVVVVGPEVILGSSRLKAGTAQKLVLNMISTGAMVAWGKTYGNLMVNFRPVNRKLWHRGVRMVAMIADVPAEVADRALRDAKESVPAAILMLKRGYSLTEAQDVLQRNGGQLRRALDSQV